MPLVEMLRRSLVFLLYFSHGLLYAAMVVTTTERLTGRIVRLEENSVVLRSESGNEQTISKDNILTIHDDEGRLIWSHPSIVLDDPTPEKPATTNRILIEPKRQATWAIEATGGLGLMSSTTWFSKYPLGVKHDYRLLWELNLTGVYNLGGGSHLTFGLGYSQRNMSANGVTLDGLYGVAVWPMQFVDVRAGYRIREDWLFVEAGLMQTIFVGSAPVTIDSGTRSTTLSDARASIGGYLGFYLGLGAIVPLYRELSGLVMFRYDHGLTSAVDANIPTQLGAAGEVVSSAPMHLIPWSVSVHAGVSYGF